MIINTNSSELNTDPCGTPHAAEALLDRALLIRTWNVLSARKFFMQVTSKSETPRAADLAQNTQRLTKLKTLLKFKKHQSAS